MPQPGSAVLGAPLLTSTDYRDVRAHGPRMRIDNLSVSTGRFVARGSAFVGTGDDCLGRAPLWPAADATFIPVFALPSGLLRQNYPRGPPRPHRRCQWHCRLRAASPLGRAKEQLLLPVPRSLPLIMVPDPAGFPERLLLGSTLRRAFRPLACLWLPPRAHLGPERRSRRYPFRLTATERGLWVLRVQDSRLLRSFPPPLRPIWTPSALLLNYTLAIPLRVIRTPTGGERATRRAYVLRRHPIPYFRPVIGIAHRSLSAFSPAPAPPLLGDPGACWQRPPPYYLRGHCPPRP